MPRKRYKPEEIVAKLRQVDVLVSQGQVMADGPTLDGDEHGCMRGPDTDLTD